MNPDVFPGSTNTVMDKERDGGGSAMVDGTDEARRRGREIVETKVVGKDESTRLA